MAEYYQLIADTVSSGKNAVVYFTETWCSLCKYMALIFAEMANNPKYSNSAFKKLDVNFNR